MSAPSPKNVSIYFQAAVAEQGTFARICKNLSENAGLRAAGIQINAQRIAFFTDNKAAMIINVRLPNSEALKQLQDAMGAAPAQFQTSLIGGPVFVEDTTSRATTLDQPVDWLRTAPRLMA